MSNLLTINTFLKEDAEACVSSDVEGSLTVKSV